MLCKFILFYLLHYLILVEPRNFKSCMYVRTRKISEFDGQTYLPTYHQHHQSLTFENPSDSGCAMSGGKGSNI